MGLIYFIKTLKRLRISYLCSDMKRVEASPLCSLKQCGGEFSFGKLPFSPREARYLTNGSGEEGVGFNFDLYDCIV